LKKFQGALIGLAVGDAVGTTLEFSSPGSFEPIDDFVDTIFLVNSGRQRKNVSKTQARQ
jgi:ADP-ribosylglycohydrolase